jgi:hypothetical protein
MTTISVDFQTNDEALKESYDQIMKDFDFAETAKIMKKMRYKWDGRKRVPGVRRIKQMVSKTLLSLIASPSPVAHYFGGRFLITKCGSDLHVHFVPVGCTYRDPLYQSISDQFRIDKLHPLMKDLRDDVKKFGGEVSYPSMAAVRHDLGDNYLGVSQDGMLSVLFEVKHLEGNGGLRYHNLYHKKKKGKNGYPSQLGRYMHDNGIKHDDIMNFPVVLGLLRGARDADAQSNNGQPKSRAMERTDTDKVLTEPA